ncbi:MFS transporter [Streptomyces sp. NPDC093801]|uniref:MFS transporter n=1 Tax=Streptomyces sp. NPDC093801 TaxID=3155203 RepID=UPI00344BFF0F
MTTSTDLMPSDVAPWRRPLTLLSAATLLNSVGTGAWLTVQAVYLVRSAGLSADQVGLGLALSGLVGMVAAAPVGRLADRHNARRVTIWVLCLEALATALFLFAHDFWLFLGITSAVMVLERGGSAVRGAMLAGLFQGAERVRARAAVRRAFNLGAATGAGLGALALNEATPRTYAVCILLNAATYAVAAVLNLLMPTVTTISASRERTKMKALRDRPFWAMTALNGLVTLHYPVLTLALPLWLTQQTELPTWTSAAAFALNTVLVAALQLRAANGTEDVTVAARRMRHAGFAVGAGCLLFAATASVSLLPAALVLLLALVVYTVGELWHSAGASGLAFGLAPDSDQGQYQGIFGIGTSLAQILAPPLVLLCAMRWGVPGWFLLAAITTLAGAAVPVVLRTMYRDRLPDPLIGSSAP